MRPDQASQLLVQALDELAQARRHLDYCWSQKRTLDSICDRTDTYARQILAK